MKYHRLGHSGLKVSAISLGSWMTYGQSVDDATTEACLTRAYDAGINFFDGAEAYGRGAAENAMGRVLRQTGWPRDTYILSGKVIRVGDRPTQIGTSRKRLRDACEATLRRYGTDYLDLFFCHRPDPDTPMEEIVVTMNHLIAQGKILYWGTSEYTPAALLEMHAFARVHGLAGPLMEQTYYNMLGRARLERDLLPLFEKFGMGTTIYSPLAGGILTGKYNDGVPPESRIGQTDMEWLKKSLDDDKVAKCRALKTVADDLGITLAQLALAWCLRTPHMSTAIIGATRPAQIDENVAAVAAADQLTPDVVTRLEAILQNKP